MDTGIHNRVVAHFLDGHVEKGITSDFLPTKDRFHIALKDAPPGTKPTEFKTADLKALFFVKHYEGNRDYEDRQEFDPNRPPAGRKIRIVFKDGEVFVGTTQGYQPGRPGFFVAPADRNSNVERCFVVCGSTQEISLL
jgi:hypothetical protein